MATCRTVARNISTARGPRQSGTKPMSVWSPTSDEAETVFQEMTTAESPSNWCNGTIARITPAVPATSPLALCVRLVGEICGFTDAFQWAPEARLAQPANPMWDCGFSFFYS